MDVNFLINHAIGLQNSLYIFDFWVSSKLKQAIDPHTSFQCMVPCGTVQHRAR